jgi:hypothetical protein
MVLKAPSDSTALRSYLLARARVRRRLGRLIIDCRKEERENALRPCGPPRTLPLPCILGETLSVQLIGGREGVVPS